MECRSGLAPAWLMHGQDRAAGDGTRLDARGVARLCPVWHLNASWTGSCALPRQVEVGRRRGSVGGRCCSEWMETCPVASRRIMACHGSRSQQQRWGEGASDCVQVGGGLMLGDGRRASNQATTCLENGWSLAWGLGGARERRCTPLQPQAARVSRRR